jgi:hypothetical protein
MTLGSVSSEPGVVFLVLTLGAVRHPPIPWSLETETPPLL